MRGTRARRVLYNRWVWAAVSTSAITLSVIASGATSADSDHPAPINRLYRRSISPGTPVITVGNETEARSVPSGFLGWSLEFPAIQAYGRRNPSLFEQLVRNLAPGQSPVIKVGGDSTDWAWWPVPGVSRPPGARYSLGSRWLNAARRVVGALRARLILGIDLEADSPAVADTEARAFLEGIGRRRIEAFELGNEPELYPSWGWYRAADGREIPGRPPGYDFSSYIRDFADVAATLPRVPLAGPAIGAAGWMRHVGRFIAAEPRLSLVTLHRYPLQRCDMPAASPLYPTIHNLLAPFASEGLARSVARFARLAHRRGQRLRIDELNSVSCGGASGVSNTFASALWALDATFQMVSVGVDGVNVHTFPGAKYQLFGFRRLHGTWGASVRPEYYGLMMFARAAPPASRLLQINGAARAHVHAWATRGPDGTKRIVLINDDVGHARLAALRIPWPPHGATLERLMAPGIRSTSGVTLGGQSFGSRTTTGVLAGPKRIEPVAQEGHEYVVRLPAASAALLTVP